MFFPNHHSRLLIREAGVNDLLAVHSVTQMAYAEQRDIIGAKAHVFSETPQELYEHLVDGWVMLLAELTGRPVGAVRLRRREGELYIGRLAVIPPARRQGIGRALMAAAEAWGRASGLPSAKLGAREDVPLNWPYYEMLGYTVIERIELRNAPGHYFWAMRKALALSPEESSPATTTIASYEDYAQCYAERHSYTWAGRALHIFSKVTPPPACIGALGCGPGKELLTLRGHGYNPIGIDGTRAMLRLARGTGAPLVCADLRSLPIVSGALDGIWASASLLHVPRLEIAIALHELRRIVQRGGALLLTLKQGDGEEWRQMEAGRRFFAFYQPDEVRRLLLGVGFGVVDQWIDAPPSFSEPWIATIGRAV